MKMPEIERDLRGHTDRRVIYHLMRMQEEISALQMENKKVAEILGHAVDALQKLQAVNVELNARWQRQLNRDDKGLVSSVMNKPEPD